MIQESTFPNPLANDSYKNSEAYGLKIMNAAYDRWNGGVGGESSTQRKNRYEYNRSYAAGQQPMQEFKDILDLDGDMSVINLAYDPLPIAIPFISRLIDRYMQRTEKIQCNAIDPLSQTKREKAKADALFKLKEKEKIQALQQEAGVQLEEFTEDDPQDERELELRFGFTYKQREEVIMEQGIDLIFYDNDWNGVIKKRILRDLVICGIAQAKPYIDPNGRIKIRVTPPENIVSSYTEWDDFRDTQYQGEVYEMSISDIRLKYPKKLSEKRLWELAQSHRGKYGNSAQFPWSWSGEFTNAIARPYDSFKVAVLELDLKTLYNLTYESKEDRFGKEVLDKVKQKKSGKKYLDKPYEVDYLGVWIIDTDILLEWGLSKNMIKPEDNITEVKLPWVTFMYNNNKMTNKPLLETMIPDIKQMQICWLQQQKIIANAAPDGYSVDISTISDINLGLGMESVSPMDLAKIFKQTGIQYYKRIPDENSEGGTRDAPIQPFNVPFSAKLEQFMNLYNAHYDNLMRIVGTNNLDAGIINNQAVGKGVLQEAKQTGESSSNYIYEAFLNMAERTARLCQLRLWDIIIYGKKFGIKYYDGYVQALGSDRIEYVRIEGDDDFEKVNFDVKIQAVIDDSEMQYLENNIQVCLANDTITLQDAIEIRLLAKTNIKYASYMLSFKDKKRRKERMEEAAANNQANTEAAIAAANAKTDGEMALEQLKADNKSRDIIETLDSEKEKETSKFASILKSKVVEGLLTQGKSIQEIQMEAPWVFDGIGVINASQKELMLKDQQDMAMQQQQEEEALLQQEEQMAMEQQMIGQEQGIPQEEMMPQ